MEPRPSVLKEVMNPWEPSTSPVAVNWFNVSLNSSWVREISLTAKAARVLKSTEEPSLAPSRRR